MKAFKQLIIVSSVSASLLIFAGAASAHVTVSPNESTAGGYTQLDVRVPNEKDVPTTEVAVSIPEGIDSVSVQPVPGWTYKITRTKLEKTLDNDGEKVTDRISEIAWTGGEIKAGEFFDFPISVHLPADGEIGNKIFFPALQTYEGGEVVKWIMKPADADDTSDLELPAPSVTLTPADADEHGAAAAADTKTDSSDKSDKADDKADDADAASSDDVDSAKTLGTIGIALGGLGLLVALFAFGRAGRKR